MQNEHDPTPIERPLASTSTGQLVGQLAKETTELVKKEIALAQSELRRDLKREIKMAEGLTVAGEGSPSRRPLPGPEGQSLSSLILLLLPVLPPP